MRRIIACMTAAALFASMTACHTQTSDTTDMTEPSGATLEVHLSHSYKSERLGLDGCYISGMVGDRVLLRSYPENYSETGKSIYTLYDLNTRSFVGNTLELEGIDGAAVTDDTIELFYQVWSEEEKTYHSYLLTCDSELNPISEEEVSDLWREAETPTPKWGIDALMALVWVKDADGNEYIGGNDGLWCKTTDNVMHQVQGVGASSELFFDQKGRLYSVYDSQTIKLVDTENFTSENISLPNLPKQSWNNGRYAPGNSTYDFTYSDGVSVYGVKLDEGVQEELMNWQDSDFSADVSSYRLLEDGRFLVMENDLYLAEARTQEEVDAIELISLVTPQDTAMGNDDYIEEMVHRFNREHDGCRIVIRSLDPDNTLVGWDELEAELLDGIVPDMIIGDGAGFHNYESFSNMGLFEDMKPWMENDPDFNPDDYLYNVFEALSYKGRYEQIAFAVTAEGFFMKAEHLNEAGTLTMEDLQALTADMMLYEGARQSAAISWIFTDSIRNYIDYASGTCSFDSPEFVQCLELLGTLPETRPVENEDAYKNDEILLDYSYNLSPQEFHNAKDTFGTEDIVIVGNPLLGEAGEGGSFRANCPLVVSSQSQYKELIWEFIKFCLREENQIGAGVMLYMYNPVNLAALEAWFQEACEAEPYTHWVNDAAVTVYPPTPEEAEIVLEDLKSITSSVNNDTFILSIVQEEAGMYFSGDCTAQEAAERIQGRVSIYLAERS